jgi:Tol biopolymer transport system component
MAGFHIRLRTSGSSVVRLSSLSLGLALLAGAALLVIGGGLSRAQSTEATVRVSVASDGTQGNGRTGTYYFGLSISGDGRYVAFESDASNLVPGDTNNETDVFVHDRETGETTLVSGASDGTQGDDSSQAADISADGRYVAFDSGADNLVPGCRGSVFVHDRETGETSCVSVASDGTPGYGGTPSISADGRYVAFESYDGDLVPGDTTGSDVFVHDRETGETTLVSVASDGTRSNSFCWLPSISGDGRYVAFDS